MPAINFFRIISINRDKLYIGSAVKPIEERLKRHEYDYKHFLDGKQDYITSYDILKKRYHSIELTSLKQ